MTNKVTDADARVQYIALFLIILASVVMSIASYFGWKDVINFATAFGGGGVGLLTAKTIMNATGAASPDPSTLPDGSVIRSTSQQTVQIPPITPALPTTPPTETKKGNS